MAVPVRRVPRGDRYKWSELGAPINEWPYKWVAGVGAHIVYSICCLFIKKRVIDQFVAVVAGQCEAKSV